MWSEMVTELQGALSYSARIGLAMKMDMEYAVLIVHYTLSSSQLCHTPILRVWRFVCAKRVTGCLVALLWVDALSLPYVGTTVD